MSGIGQKYKGPARAIHCERFRDAADRYCVTHQINRNQLAKLLGGKHKIAGDFAPFFYAMRQKVVKTAYADRMVELLGPEILVDHAGPPGAA